MTSYAAYNCFILFIRSHKLVETREQRERVWRRKLATCIHPLSLSRSPDSNSQPATTEYHPPSTNQQPEKEEEEPQQSHEHAIIYRKVSQLW